ncbi:MAG: DNA-binding transcriptional repressor AcrR [Methanobacterium sp. PtaB.Bin024]|jgi:AcrR family transcriptional regulator|nr:MAG: DNA-binding transcriptional repressor AcrR [Methanobacterium sp. PtaB.Bin024]
MNKKSFERKNELLNAALDEFTRKNYENASLNTIIKNASISKGTFYYHFQNKQTLYLFLLETAVKTKWEFINSHMKEYPPDSPRRDIFDEFKLQAQMGMEFAVGFPQYHRLSIMFSREKGNKIYEDAKTTLHLDTESMIREMVKKARTREDLTEKFSEDFMVKILTYLFTNFDEIFHLEEDFHLDKMVENLNNYVEFMKHGMGR